MNTSQTTPRDRVTDNTPPTRAGHFSYMVTPRHQEVGGGWRLYLLENGVEVGGGAFPAEEGPDECDAYLDATGQGEQWLLSNALSASTPAVMSQAAHDVLAERRRHVEQEGWAHERDDQYTDYSLPRAAAAYAAAAAMNDVDRTVLDEFTPRGITAELQRLWPSSWAIRWFKPKSRRADLVKAGALILAEIERLDRASEQRTDKHIEEFS